jgi:hypothetical protein
VCDVDAIGSTQYSQNFAQCFWRFWGIGSVSILQNAQVLNGTFNSATSSSATRSVDLSYGGRKWNLLLKSRSRYRRFLDYINITLTLPC